MTLPDLPAVNSTDWYAWAQGVHAALLAPPADSYTVAPGSWWAPHSAATTTQLLTVNRAYLIPIDLPSTQVWTGLGFEVTGAAASSGIRTGIYGSTAAGMPDLSQLVKDLGVTDTQTVGQKLVTGVSFSLTKNRYWVAFAAQGSAPTVRAIQGTNRSFPLPQGVVPAAGSFYLQHAIQGNVSAALPTSGTVVASDGLPPKLYLQAQ